MNARSFLLVAFLVVIAATAGDQARPAVVTQILDTAGGVSWTTGSIWDDGLPAQAGNDYVNPAGRTLRTPDNVNNPVFPGDSLTVRGILAAKHNGTATFSDLRLDGGTVGAWTGNRTMGIGGTVTVLSNSNFEMGGTTDRRTLQLEGTLLGSGNLRLFGSGNPAQFILRADTTGYTGQWIIDSTLDGLFVDGGAMNLTAGLTIGDLRVGANGGIATLTVSGGPVSLGSPAGTSDFWVGYKTTSGAAVSTGTADFRTATSFSAVLDELGVGVARAGGTPDNPVQGTLLLSPNATIDANTIYVADSTNPGMTSLTSTLTFGSGTSNVTAGTFTVGGRKGLGVANIAAGGALNLGTVAERADLLIGRKTSDTGATSNGTLDLSAGAAFTAYLDELLVGTQSSASAGAGGATGTLRLAPNTTLDANLIVLGDLDADIATTTSATLAFGTGTNTVVTPNFIVGRRKGTATATLPAGATLNLTGPGGTGADLRIGSSDTNTGYPTTGTMTLTGGTFNATLDELVIGYHRSKTGGSGTGTLSFDAGAVTANSVVIGDASTSAEGDGTGQGTLNLSGAALLTAGSMSLGTGSAASTGTLNVTGGTVTVTGAVTGGVGTGTVNVNGGVMSVGGGFDVDNLRVGYNGRTATLTVGGGAVTIGSGAGTLDIARRDAASDVATHGTLDLGAAASVAIDVANLRLGTITNVSLEGDNEGILTLAQAGPNAITATSIVVGDSPARSNNGFLNVIHFGGAGNTVAADTFLIGGGKSLGRADIAAGGSLQIGSAAQRTDLLVGRNQVGGTGVNVVGELDLRGGSQFQATLGSLAIGQKGDTSDGKARGEVWLATNNTIDADSILVGQSGNSGADTAADQSRLHLGGGVNTILTPTLLVGDRKTTGLIDFATAGGTLNLGTAAARTQITLGRKSVDTGANPAGTMDLRGGTANIFASAINLGQETNTAGAGNPSGTIWLANGSLDVSGNVSENHAAGGAGTSTLYVVGNQTFNIGGYIAVDSLVIGLNGTAGSVVYAGAAAQIGTPTDRTDLFVGRRTADTAATYQGTLDLSGVPSFTAYLDEFGVGTMQSGMGGSQGAARGVVTLAAANTIDARIITISDSPEVGLGSFNNRIVLGTTNAITADTLIVGGNKSGSTADGGSMQFAPGGGTLDLGTAGRRVDVFVGRETVGTGGGAAGHLNMAGGTLNAFIDQLIIGTKPNTATGTTKGVVTMDAGAVDVNTIVLGERTNAGTAGAVQGTFNLRGGTLAAQSIVKGAGNGANAADVAAFNWTGGTLHVGTFGTPAAAFNLVQGGGTLAPDGLAPGDPIGTSTIWGNYTQNAGDLEIQIAGAGAPGVDYDLLVVEGNSPGGDLLVDLVGFTPGLGDYFDVLQVAGGIAPGDWNILGDRPGVHTWEQTLLARSGGGNILRLTAVPEPSTLVLAALAVVVLLGYGWRRKTR